MTASNCKNKKKDENYEERYNERNTYIKKLKKRIDVVNWKIMLKARITQ